MIGVLLAVAAFAAAAAAAPGSVSVSTDSAAPGAAAEQRLHDLCSAQGTIDVGALLASAPGRRDLEPLAFGEVRDLADYSACRDLQSATDGCSALDGLGGRFGGDGAAACRARAAADRFVFFVVRGGDALGACRDIFKPEGKSGPSVDSGCAAMIKAARAGDVLAACPEARRQNLTGSEEDCRNDLAFWGGTAEACARIKDLPARRECRASAALVAGLRDPARCPASPACRALEAKSPAACSGLRESFSRTLCGRVAKSVDAEARRRAKIEEDRRRNESRLKDAARAKERADAVVKAKAAAAAKAEAAAKAKKAANAGKPQYVKGQPMRRSGDVKDIMDRLEKGLPINPVKPATTVPPEAGDATPASP